jgi:hypothetical protein
MNNEQKPCSEIEFGDTIRGMGVLTDIRYFGHGRYFPDDKSNRDIYEITIQKGKNLYRLNFGQSIVNSGKGKDNRIGAKAPELRDIYFCLTKTSPGTFEDFCGEYGYDADSISAFKTYCTVAEEYNSIRRIFSHEELSNISELLQDY